MPKIGDHQKELSTTYYGACSRMQEACTVLYEDLHTSSGDPHTSIEYVYEKIGEHRKWLLLEADLIREAARQHYEAGNSRG
jgi:hypothetical protein